ncbi:MAG: AAA family ATPase [Spirochaetota bacterium]|nr:AAA family ATPase [Spirochaetota bacterium]
MSKYLTIAESQKILGLSKSKVYELKNDPHVKEILGRDIIWEKNPERYLEDDIIILKEKLKRHNTKIICFTAFKGGVGKTTSSGEVGAILAQKGYQTLLIDLDYTQCNLTSDFGEEDEFEGKTLYDVFRMAKTIDEVIHNSRIDNLYYIPGSIRLSEYQAGQLKRTILKEKLEKTNFDFIIIDLPPSINDATFWGLNAATEAYIPVIPDKYSLKGIESNIMTINITKEQTNPKLQLKGLFVTMAQKGTTVAELIKEVVSDKSLPWLNVIIPRRQEVVNARNNGHFVAEINPNSDLIKEYNKLVEVILNGR